MPSTESDAPERAGAGVTVAFAGLGAMGGPMVRQLAAAGTTLRLFDIRADACRALAEETGAVAAASAAEAGEGADIAITMVADHHVVRKAVLGASGDGLVARMAPGGIVVDMSSSFAPATRALGADLAPRGIALLDAPVSGGVRRARDGTLAIMLGGDDAAALDRAEPVLSNMGRVFRTGPLGSGHALKALNNFVSAAGLQAACEAVIVGRRFGLDPEVIVDVLNASTGRNNATENKLKQFILNADYGSGFALALMAKDLGLAADLGAGQPTLAATHALWRAAAAALPEDADHTEIMRFLEDRPGGAEPDGG